MTDWYAELMKARSKIEQLETLLSKMTELAAKNIPLINRVEQLERENAALLADARRMDWIQRQDFDDLYFIIFQDQPNDGKYGVSQGCIGKGWAIGDTFRAAIDAAIDAEMAKGEA